MILVILLQRGRGGGLAGAFGGAGGQSAFGTKAGDVFTRVTIGVAIAWVILAGVAGMLLRAGQNSGVSDQFESKTGSLTTTEDTEKDKDSVPPLNPLPPTDDTLMPPPIEGTKPESESTKPADQPAAEGDKTTDKPADPQPPAEGDKPSTEEKPATPEKPADGEKPAEEAKPADPATESAPAETPAAEATENK